MKIKSIELGWGTHSTYYSTAIEPKSPYYVDEIRIDEITARGSVIMLSYVGYRDNKPVFRMFAGNNITIYY